MFMDTISFFFQDDDISILNDLLWLRLSRHFVRKIHNENIPMQYTEIFKVVKSEIFQYKIYDNFLFLLKT